jgi:hypothetical protein
VPIHPPRAERTDEVFERTLVVVGEHDLPDIKESAGHLAETLSHHELVVTRRPPIVLPGESGCFQQHPVWFSLGFLSSPSTRYRDTARVAFHNLPGHPFPVARHYVH